MSEFKTNVRKTYNQGILVRQPRNKKNSILNPWLYNLFHSYLPKIIILTSIKKAGNIEKVCSSWFKLREHRKKYWYPTNSLNKYLFFTFTIPNPVQMNLKQLEETHWILLQTWWTHPSYRSSYQYNPLPHPWYSYHSYYRSLMSWII